MIKFLLLLTPTNLSIVLGILLILIIWLIIVNCRVTVNKYYPIGVKALDKQNYQKAKKIFKKILKKFPTHQNSLHKLGLVYFKLGNYKKAEENFEKITARNPEHFEAIYNLALSNQMINELQSAKKLYEQALEIDQDDFDCVYNLGLTNYKLKCYKEALDDFQKANDINENKPLILYYIAKCQDHLNTTNNIEIQKEITESYLKLMDETDLPEDYLITTARSVAKTGELKQTLIILNKALESNPEDAECYKLAALTDLLQFKKEDAKSNILIAIDLDPNDNEAYNILKHTKGK